MKNLRLEDINKSFGSVFALKGVSLDIAPGEFLVLLGPSGCGKSTLLRIIAGLVEQSSGSVSIGDRSLDGLTPRERNVAFVFQSYALYPQMTVWQNISFPLIMTGARWWHHLPFVSGIRRRVVSRRPEVQSRVNGVVEILELGHLINRRPGTLSGGQRQRVAVGRAMVREPELYLMDEPLSNLDAKLRIQLRSELVALHRRMGTTTVYVTHDQAEAMSMGTRIAVMDHGVVQQVGTPKEIQGNPANAFVAGFVGNPPLSLLSASVHKDEPMLSLTASGTSVMVPASWDFLPSATRHTGGVLLGIRSQDVKLMSASYREADFVGRVIDVEDIGDEAFVRVAIESEESQESVLMRGESLTVSVPSGEAPSTDQIVGLLINWSSVMMFDAETGVRIRATTDTSTEP